jgi:molybdopterin molybdotransferase
MLAVADALQIVLAHCRPLPPTQTTLLPDALGRILAEDVASDLDMPPFDKALMDGYAVRAAEIDSGRATLPVAAEVMAGQTPPPLPPGQAIRIMTGAPIPAGADAVIRVEQTKNLPDGRVQIEATPPKPGQFILRRAAEMRVGEVVLQAGTVLRAPEIGLLASVGRATVRAIPPATVSILATGDELVEAADTPGPGQLRNSNGPMLVAQSARAGATVRYLGIGRDEPAALRTLMQEGLNTPALILAGGVSMGQRDLAPAVLQELGVQPHVHRVAMKPGKPFFFGTRGNNVVFGLPGNPVSAFCCFELFVRPALRKLAGQTQPGPDWRQAELAEPIQHSSDRPTYHPAMLEGNRVRTVAWFGSPDLRGLTRANALVLLPAGTHTFSAGAEMSVLRV